MTLKRVRKSRSRILAAIEYSILCKMCLSARPFYFSRALSGISNSCWTTRTTTKFWRSKFRIRGNFQHVQCCRLRVQRPWPTEYIIFFIFSRLVPSTVSHLSGLASGQVKSFGHEHQHHQRGSPDISLFHPQTSSFPVLALHQPGTVLAPLYSSSNPGTLLTSLH